MQLFWQLPGPKRFLENASKDLAVGKNVVLGLPAFSPPGLQSGLKELTADVWTWNTIEVTNEVPTVFFFRRFVRERKPSTVPSVSALVQAEEFENHLLWLEGLNQDNWPLWKRFIEDYQHACRMKAVTRRSLFIVPLSGSLASVPPADDIALSYRPWRDTVNELDMLIYATVLLQDKPMVAKQRNLLAAVIARVALWDPFTAERLIQLPAKEVLRPQRALRELAAERGWTNDTPVSWEKGTQNVIDGRTQVHAALLALNDGQGRLEKRIWSAEISVILPLLEEQRQALIPTVRPFLRFPINTGYSVITDAQDLEIGHLANQLNGAGVNPSIRQRIYFLRRIRNQLAHMTVLAPEDALAPELYEELNGL